MEDFELRLKRIPLVRPPSDMKRKIFGTGPSGPRILAVFRHRIPLGWAAAFAILTGLAGMSLSQWLKPAAVPGKAVVVQNYIIKAPSEQNPFDFTEASTEFMPGKLTVKVREPEEI